MPQLRPMNWKILIIITFITLIFSLLFFHLVSLPHLLRLFRIRSYLNKLSPYWGIKRFKDINVRFLSFLW